MHTNSTSKLQIALHVLAVSCFDAPSQLAALQHEVALVELACSCLKRKLLQHSACLQALDVTDLVACKGSLDQTGQALQALHTPQTPPNQLHLYHLLPPSICLGSLVTLCAACAQLRFFMTEYE